MTYKVGAFQVALQSKKPQEDFLETAYGAFRSLQFCDKLFSLLGKAGYATNFLKESASICNKGWTILALPRVPGQFGSLTSEIQNFKTAMSSGLSCRTYVRLAMEVATFSSVACFAALPFVGAAQKTAQVAKLLLCGSVMSTISDVTDFYLTGSDVLAARSFSSLAVDVEPELQTALAETKTLYSLKTMKVASSILGTGLGLAGVAAFPGAATAAAVISLATTTLAIGSSLYEKGMHQEKIKFFDTKHVQQLTPVVA